MAMSSSLITKCSGPDIPVVGSDQRPGRRAKQHKCIPYLPLLPATFTDLRDGRRLIRYPVYVQTRTQTVHRFVAVPVDLLRCSLIALTREPAVSDLPFALTRNLRAYCRTPWDVKSW